MSNARRPRGVVWLVRALAVLPVRFYRLVISPLLPRTCRFEPTCSAYAVDAVLEHGVIRGGWLAARRLGRCQPITSHGGYDPVPALRAR